jgi:hypothetical protein
MKMIYYNRKAVLGFFEDRRKLDAPLHDGAMPDGMAVAALGQQHDA